MGRIALDKFRYQDRDFIRASWRESESKRKMLVATFVVLIPRMNHLRY